MSFIESFLARAAAAPDAIAIELDGEDVRVTYAALRARMQSARGVMRRRGVLAGDTVLISLPSGPELVAVFYAVASLGAIAVPVSAQLRPFELAPVLTDARPAFAVVSTDEHAGLLASCASTRAVLRVTELAGPEDALAPPDGDPVVSCHFTYKGLGHPLGALHRYSHYAHCMDALKARFASAQGGTHLVALPMYPVYSLLAAVMAPLASGARLVVARRSDRAHILDLLAQHQARFACLVPLLFAGLVARAKAAPELVRALSPDLQLASGGSGLLEGTADAVASALGIEPMQGYGLSETLPVSTNYPARSRRGSLGVALSDEVRVGVVDAFGRDVAPGRVGEIVVAGPTITCGFVNRPAETARFLRGGRFHTGDLGWLDEDGFLHFAGRSLPFTKCASQMVDLCEIESLLRRHPKIADARATVSVDARVGERVRVSVILERGATMTAHEVTAYCKQHLSSHKVPRAVDVLERTLPKAVGQ